MSMNVSGPQITAALQSFRGQLLHDPNIVEVGLGTVSSYDSPPQRLPYVVRVFVKNLRKAIDFGKIPNTMKVYPSDNPRATIEIPTSIEEVHQAEADSHNRGRITNAVGTCR